MAAKKKEKREKREKKEEKEEKREEKEKEKEKEKKEVPRDPRRDWKYKEVQFESEQQYLDRIIELKRRIGDNEHRVSALEKENSQLVE